MIHKTAVARRMIVVALGKIVMALHIIVMVPHRIEMVLHRIEMAPHRIEMVLQRIEMALHRIEMTLHRIEMVPVASGRQAPVESHTPLQPPHLGGGKVLPNRRSLALPEACMSGSELDEKVLACSEVLVGTMILVVYIEVGICRLAWRACT